MNFGLPRPMPRGAIALLVAFALSSPCLAAELGVDELRFLPGSSITIVWDPAPDADGYGIHRGGIGHRGFSSYDHVCLATEISEALAVDDAVPAPGRAFYYLATGQMRESTGRFVSGPLGFDGEGSQRPDGAFKCAVRVFVDPEASGAGDGSSWANAFTTLGAALRDSPTAHGATTIWMTGIVQEDELLVDVPSPRILGGFAGDEERAWERDVSAHPTRWRGFGDGSLIWLDQGGSNLLVDGVVMSDADRAVYASGAGCVVDVRDARFERVEAGVDVETWGGARSSISMRSTRCADDAPTALRACAYEGPIDVRMRHVVIEDAGAPGILLRALPYNIWPSRIDAEILACTIHGGDPAIAVEASSQNNESLSDEGVADVTIASTAILDADGHGVVFDANGEASEPLASPVEATATGRIVGCTIDAPSGSAVVTRATRRPDANPPEMFPVNATPEIWDSLLTGAGGYAVRESEDDEAGFVRSDPVLVGVNLHGADVLYLDEGLTSLFSIAEINALEGSRDNVDEDPGYVQPGVDRHLASDSSSIDQGHADAPSVPAVDVDGDPRRHGAARDRGADEHRPLP